ncbi:MAG TPA: prepilin-type N-terminal cleavage/methylation domain-containing protein [Longimicrobiales bacterium]|nr:prepilin-type N-terminal cleavage/methylation domain-containing protein [Longimicrobiales bacterium]
MRSRDGFTITEVLIVLILVGIIGGFAFARVGSMLAQTRVQRAASVVAADLKLAHSMAGRQRVPIRVSIDPTARVFRLRDYTTPTTIYSERHFHNDGEYPVESFLTSKTSLLVYPNGLADGSVEIELRAGGKTRVVRMSRAGQVRVSGS